MMERDLLEEIRKTKPLVHLIINDVTRTNCVNAVLAIGASAICGEAIEEVEDITGICNALVLNIGTPNREKYKAMLLACAKANEIGIPVVLDPVGVGVSNFRKEFIKELLGRSRVTIIRGNMSEMRYLHDLLCPGDKAFEGLIPDENASINRNCNCNCTWRKNECPKEESRGVDSSEKDWIGQEELMELSIVTGAALVMTGKRDVIVSPREITTCDLGSIWQTRLTGFGCMLSACLGAIASTVKISSNIKGMKVDTGCPRDDLMSRLQVPIADFVRIYGMCGEAAEKRLRDGDGAGSYMTYFMDALSRVYI